MQRDAAEFLALMASRQSVSPKRLAAPGPTPEELAAIVGAASSAPDHGALQPFRCIHIADSARGRLADIFVEARRRRSPASSRSELEREREKALNGPTLLVACARLQRDAADVPVPDQLVSVGAAIQNILLAAHALGFGAIVLSGEKAGDPLLRDSLGLGADEMLIGFICIGTITTPPPPKLRRPVEEFLSIWTGPPW